MRIRRPLIGILLASCSGKTPAAAPVPGAGCKATPVEITLTAADNVNSAGATEGRPVQVRVYLLKQEDRLRTASFVDIWQDDRKTLENDFVSVEEKTAYPGATLSIELAPNPAAGFVSIVALFREPQDQKWYLSYPLPIPSDKGPCLPTNARFSVRLEGLQIEDSEGPPSGPERHSPN